MTIRNVIFEKYAFHTLKDFQRKWIFDDIMNAMVAGEHAM